MDASPSQSETLSPGFLDLVMRALTDEDYRDRFFTDRESAVEGYRLSELDRRSLDHLSREQLEEQAKEMTQSSATAIGIGIGVSGHFDTPGGTTR
jgi:hypothetical protein